MNNRVTALYIRVSHEEQKINGDSLRMQEEQLIEYCKLNQIKKYRIYTDAGVSARDFKKRLALKELLEDVKKNQIETILFVRFDRWVRTHDYHRIQEVLEKHDTTWKSITQQLDTKTASGRLNVNILISVAQNEIEQTSERIRLVFKSKLNNKEAISGQVPYGYKIENKRLVIDGEKVNLVQEIFSKYLEIQSLFGVVMYLQDTYNISKYVTYIKNILTNELYTGTYRRNGHFIEDYCPAIIDKDIFNQVQQLLNTRSKSKSHFIHKHVYLFSKKLKCPHCGASLVGSSANLNSKKYYQYRCPNFKRNSRTCDFNTTVNEKTIEKNIVEDLEKHLKELFVKIDGIDKEKQIVDNRKNLSIKLKKLVDLYLNELIDKSHYEQEYKRLNELIELEKSKAKKEKRKEDIHQTIELLNAYDTFTPQQKKLFWLNLIDKIEILEVNKDKNKLKYQLDITYL